MSFTLDELSVLAADNEFWYFIRNETPEETWVEFVYNLRQSGMICQIIWEHEIYPAFYETKYPGVTCGNNFLGIKFETPSDKMKFILKFA
jgi:hypothetical protein